LSLAALVGIATLWSSPLPDTYESSAQQTQMAWLLGDRTEEAP
jgi:hypothetical protein